MQIQIVMYNAFTAKKLADSQQIIRKRSQTTNRYVSRYYNKTRPSLIDSYNKRINSFIRRLEEQPIKVSLDPNIRQDEQGDTIQDPSDKFIGQHTFKFKDNEDWKSMYTPWERIQRKKNYYIFKVKYGDPDLAFRSIGSQSNYNSSLSNQFRIRQKTKQINPPMKYTNKPTQQVLASINKNRKKKKSNRSSGKDISGTRRGDNQNYSRQEQYIGRRNTGSSLSGLNDDFSQNDAISYAKMTDYGQSQRQRDPEHEHEHQHQHKKQKKQKQMKLHFKQIMDLQQNITDVKTKKALRDLLYKCGVYRRKSRRISTDSEIDKFSQLESATTNHK